MSIECQNCGNKIPDELVWDETNIPEGHELVLHQQNRPNELGVLTDYYCDPRCFAEAEDA